MLIARAELDIVLVKFHTSIEMGEALPMVRLNRRGETIVVERAFEMMDVELLN